MADQVNCRVGADAKKLRVKSRNLRKCSPRDGLEKTGPWQIDGAGNSLGGADGSGSGLEELATGGSPAFQVTVQKA